MNKSSLLFVIALLWTSSTYSQIFLPLQTGPLVNTPSDSRSVNIFDANGDGWEDVLISNGLSGGQADQLYLNDSVGNFIPLNSSDLVEEQWPSVGATVADYDNDGDMDIYLTNWYGRRNRLYLNDGEAQFSVLENASTASGSHSETASWGDYDNDGLLDLVVTNSDGSSRRNVLYRNLGNGELVKQNDSAINAPNGVSRNANWVDYDNDGDSDLYITNEGSQANEMYRNEGGILQLVTENIRINRAYSTMSSNWGDIDNDGDLDLFLANSGYFSESPNALLRNEGDGTFSRITEGDIGTIAGCNFGSNFGDVDNDGDLDLILTSAFCNSDRLQDQLFLNDGTGQLYASSEWSQQSPALASYGAAFGDLNQDGFLDLVIAHCKNNTSSPQPANALWLNQGNDNHWLRICLEGQLSNRSAIGARVWVYDEINGMPRQQLRELSTQSGYAGQNSLIQHFGLGASEEVDSVMVEWPSGLRSVLGTTAVDQLVKFVEPLATGIWRVSTGPIDSWSVYPNPSAGTDLIYLESKEQLGAKEVEVSLYRADGALLWRDSLLVREKEVLDLQLPRPLASGGYRLTVWDGEVLWAERLMVK